MPKKLKRKSLYELINRSILSILLFSFAVSLMLSSLWLIWMTTKQNDFTHRLVTQKLNGYMYDLVAANSMSQEAFHTQLQMILKDFDISCYAIVKDSDATSSKECPRTAFTFEVPLASGGIDIGSLHYKLYYRVPRETLLFVVTNFLIFFMATTATWLVLLRNIRQNVLTPLDHIANEIAVGKSLDDPNDEIEEIFKLRTKIETQTERMKDHIKYQSIAQTTQMLAHDVRKPFSMLKGIMDSLGDASPEEVRKLVQNYLPDVERSMREVNGLLSDILEIDASHVLDAKPYSVIDFVKSSIESSEVLLQNKNVSFQYNWGHNHLLHVDSKKVARVFHNIISNALEAVHPDDARIVVSTYENKTHVHISVFNSGSFVPPESQVKIFHAFYTSGKANGTGLGLAIAKKIVCEHQGEIWCESRPNYGTTFHMTLPKNEMLDKPVLLPLSSRAWLEEIDARRQSSAREHKLARVETLRPKKDDSVVRLLICDDEEIYRSILARRIAQSQTLSRQILPCFASYFDEALTALQNDTFDMMILDVDLGGVRDGFDLAKEAKKLQPNLFICCHSNRMPTAEQYARGEGAVNVYQPKPMTKDVLVDLVAQLKNRDKPRLALVDDCALTRHLWSREAMPFTIEVFVSPKDFFAKNPDGAEHFQHIITDFYFENEDATDGVSFAKILREKGYDGHLHISTNMLHLDEEDLIQTRMKRLPKDPQSALEALL